MYKIALKSLLAYKRRFVLTFLSVVMGVVFVSGTYIFTDRINSAFSNLFGDIYQGVDIVISAGDDSESSYFSEEVLQTVEQTAGIDKFSSAVSGELVFLDKEGSVVGVDGATPFGFSWDKEEALNPLTIRDGNGRAPEKPGEVVIDVGSAEKYDFKIGDIVKVSATTQLQEFTIVGLVNFGSLDNLAGSSLLGFELRQAQELFDLQQKLVDISIIVKDGESVDEVVQTLQVKLSDNQDITVKTSEQERESQVQEIEEGLGFLNIFLQIFAAVAIFVSTFVIQNTFRIITAQRVREIALLRSTGATRRQILLSIITEAWVVGVLASIAGLVLGVAATVFLQWLLERFGIDLPKGDIVIKPRTVVMAFLVGIGVTIISSLSPAWRASRISPMQAMSDSEAVKRNRSLKWRNILGVILMALGVAAIAVALLTDVSKAEYVSTAGIGAVFYGVVALAPWLLQVYAKLMKLLLKKLGPISGIATGNLRRTPRRVAITSMALMIAVTLVSGTAAMATSIESAAKKIIAESLPADLTIFNARLQRGADPAGYQGGISEEVVTELRQLQELELVTATTYRENFKVDDKGGFYLIAVEPDQFHRAISIKPDSDDYSELNELNTIFIKESTLESHGKNIGDTVSVSVKGYSEAIEMEIVGSFKDAFDGDHLMSLNTMQEHFPTDYSTTIYANYKPNIDIDEARSGVDKVLEDYPLLKAQSGAELQEEIVKLIDQLLVIIWALLSLAVIVSIFGITNTLSLSITERVREVGMLRAVGMTKRQSKSIIFLESTLMAFFGAVLGVAMGLFLARVTVYSLRDFGLSEYSVPYLYIAIIFIASIFIGMLASIFPARKIAKVEMIEAMSDE